MIDKKKIIIVEDDETLSASLGEMLRQEGFIVFFATDGEGGLAMAKKEIPDLMLLDVMIPKLDGVHLLEKIRENEETKDIIVMMLTNRDDVETVGESVGKGISDYIVKHEWRLEDIAKKVKQRLGMSQGD